MRLICRFCGAEFDYFADSSKELAEQKFSAWRKEHLACRPTLVEEPKK